MKGGETKKKLFKLAWRVSIIVYIDFSLLELMHKPEMLKLQTFVFKKVI